MRMIMLLMISLAYDHNVYFMDYCRSLIQINFVTHFLNKIHDVPFNILLYIVLVPPLFGGDEKRVEVARHYSYQVINGDVATWNYQVYLG